MARLIVERRFDEPLTDEEFLRMAARLFDCLDAYDARWLRSHVSKDRRRTVCAYDAPDAEAVRMVHRSAGVPFERVWLAEEVLPESLLPALQARSGAP